MDKLSRYAVLLNIKQTTCCSDLHLLVSIMTRVAVAPFSRPNQRTSDQPFRAAGLTATRLAMARVSEVKKDYHMWATHMEDYSVRNPTLNYL